MPKIEILQLENSKKCQKMKLLVIPITAKKSYILEVKS